MSADDRTVRRCARAEEASPTTSGKQAGSSLLRAEFQLGPGVSVILEGDKRTIQPDLDFYRGLVERVALAGGDAEASVAPLGQGQVKRSRRSAKHRTRVAPSRVAARRGGRKAPPQQVDLDRSALSNFYRKLRPRKGHWSEIVCFVHFLTQHHEIQEVGAADVLACFRALRLKRPHNLLPRVNAIKSRTAYLRTVSPGVFAITPAGERFVDSGARPPKRRVRSTDRRKNGRGKLLAAASSAEAVGAAAAAPIGGGASSVSRTKSGQALKPSKEEPPVEVGAGGETAGGGAVRPDVKRGGRRGSRPERKRSPGAPTSSGAHSNASASASQASVRRRRKRSSSSWSEKPGRS